MSDSNGERAEEIVHSLSEDVARFIFEEGVRHTQALQTAAHALDARATQVATILFAAAALSASAIGASFNLGGFAAAMATVFFIWGGLITFRSVESGEFRAPGLPPAWWGGALEHVATFSEKDARSWAAKQQQIVIDHICVENEKRGDALNASLRCGFVGAVLVGISAVMKLWPPLVKLLDP